MNMRNNSYQILVYLTLHTLAIYLFTLSSAQTRQWKFDRQTFCNVTLLPYDMKWSQTKIQCSIRCAKNDSCGGFVFSLSTGCKFYENSIKNETSCAENNPEAVEVYVRKKYCQHGGYLDKNHSCFCVNSYVGEFCERIMQDCSEGHASKFYTKNDVYMVHPVLAPAPFKAYCEFFGNQGAVRIQANGYIGPGIISFNRTWQEYKDGFGFINGDHWLGNQKINWITNSRPYALLVYLYNRTRQVKILRLRNFVMKGEDADFAVTYSSVSSAISTLDICWPNTSIKFSTYDRDNDQSADNCAAIYGAGFWFPYTDCAPCNPNGVINKTDVRLNISNENYWTPGMGNKSPYWSLFGLIAL